MRRILYGGLAGLAATMAMTATIQKLQRFLPRRQAYPLPPRETTQRAADLTGVDGGKGKLAAVTMAAHFAYGAITGAVYPLLTKKRSPVVGGAYGLAVWAGSYLGWIPAVRLLAPATRHPLERNLLMLAAHAIWGAALASGLQKLEQTEAAFQGERVPDAPKRRRKWSRAKLANGAGRHFREMHA
ncbi:hypothetical protein [Emcibacter sp. SYSU 3D8]|uniref:hypothetical protein n=1 Tax=Emcibacter sp. SYSU 3D8 TaxID=3133969 RepID=UPI0031FE5228